MASYEEIAALAVDQTFVARVMGCGTQEALKFIADDRPEIKFYASAVIQSPGAAQQMVWPVAGSPGITAASDDAALLSAVDALWGVVGAAYVPAAAP